MSASFDIEIVQDYLEQLCSRHTAIGHSVTKRCFARFGSGEHIAEIKRAAGKVCVVVADISGRRTGHKDDQMFARQIVMRIAVYAETKGDAAAARAAAIKLADGITMDFMLRMEKQQEDDLEANEFGPMHFLRPEEFTWEPIEDEPWLLNHYGNDLTIPFHHYMPAYDAGKWND